MSGCSEVFCAMLIYRRIAAAYMTAGQTDPQVRPDALAQRRAVLAARVGARLGDTERR